MTFTDIGTGAIGVLVSIVAFVLCFAFVAGLLALPVTLGVIGAAYALRWLGFAFVCP